MGIRVTAGWRLMLGGVALLGAGAVFASCGGDDDAGSTSGKNVDDAKAAANEELAAEKSGDADTFLKRVTDNWMKTVVGVTREEAKADPSTFQDDEPPTITKVTATGSKATIDIAFAGTGAFDYSPYAIMVKQGGDWKLDELHVKSAAKLPSGAKTVNLDLTDFAFGFTRKDITSKNVTVLHVENKGKQPHMVILEKLPAQGDLKELLQQENPQGVEEVGGAFLFSPGDKADVVIKEKLAPGRYALLCFVADLDDPQGTPHAFKGMATDFTVE